MAMTAESVVLAGRRAAEALMVDACEIGPPPQTTFSRDVGDYITASAAPVYVGVCKIQRPARARDADAGGDDPGVGDLEVHVPAGTDGIERNHVVTITAASLDAELVDRTFRVLNVPARTFATAIRLPCQEITT